eukprot:TRINITY_DN63250_c0_g1_i1.p1 TRINITY_DN63250_c0_g1~~TRINITY_DN63250_c0_g1_i1.p1  ORF type:complete len:254 (-),score=42.75 TRINITY_DN63250_c0_g1_i1:93-854(-)
MCQGSISFVRFSFQVFSAPLADCSSLRVLESSKQRVAMSEWKKNWGFENASGERLVLRETAPSDDADVLTAKVNSVKEYFEALEKSLAQFPENFGPYASSDCLMIKPTGVFMRNEGGCSREEMCKAFLTWKAPQKFTAIENIRFLGSGLDAVSVQVRIFQHFTFKGENDVESEEIDVAVMTFVLEAAEPGATGTAGEELKWRAVTVHRAFGAPPTGLGTRENRVAMPEAPPESAVVFERSTSDAPYAGIRLLS